MKFISLNAKEIAEVLNGLKPMTSGASYEGDAEAQSQDLGEFMMHEAVTREMAKKLEEVNPGLNRKEFFRGVGYSEDEIGQMHPKAQAAAPIPQQPAPGDHRYISDALKPKARADRWKLVLRLRDEERKTWKEISDSLGVGIPRARQIYAMAQRWKRMEMRRNGDLETLRQWQAKQP